MSHIQSINSHRLRSNPIESKLVETWEKKQNSKTLNYILSGVANRDDPVSDRDREVAVTIIQWVGTPIGLAFLEEALGIDDLRTQISSRSEGVTFS